MKRIPLFFLAAMALASCGSNSGSSDKSFCDTVCDNKDIVFNGDAQFQQTMTLKLKQCAADSILLTHNKTFAKKSINVSEFLGKTVKVNRSAMDVAFQDTSMVWFTFNDCLNGRGYLLKLTYESNVGMQKITGALNRFDPKFSIDKDLRAYTDRGNLYVVNVTTGKQDQMTFKKEFDIDFDKVHEVVDSVNVTKQRMFIKMKDADGSDKVFEKAIQL